MMNGMWAFPVDKFRQVHPELQKLVDACLYYTPQRHTDDRLMAMWIASMQAQKWGAMGAKSGDSKAKGQGFLGRVMQR